MLVYRIEDQLQSAKRVIENALNKPEILKKLESSKFNYKQLSHGKALLDKVVKLQNQREKEFEKHSSFSKALDIDHKFAYKEYLKHKKIVRTALKKNPELAKALKLNGDKTLAVPGWLDQAMIFYKNIGYIANYMAEQGVDEAELIQVRTMIEALRDAKHAQQKMRKIAQEATLQRDKALNELEQWMYQFQSVAQIALQDDLHTLEALGLEVES